MSLSTNHILKGNELSKSDLTLLLQLANELKKDPLKYSGSLKGKHLAMIFDKPSLRTRMSFIVAMHDLGGKVVESVSAHRKSEEPEDQMRVLQGYCQAVMVRTHEDRLLERMGSVGSVPLINGLSNRYHPCQILADLQTLQNRFSCLSGLSLAYIGDGNNILHSLLLMLPKLGVKVHYSCPKNCQPDFEVLREADANYVKGFPSAGEAVKGCQAVYTDVWNSMGFNEKDDELFQEYQVNEELMKRASSDAIFLHCMPMVRGKEVSETLPDHSCSAIFEQSENRMHAQKALLYLLLA